MDKVLLAEVNISEGTDLKKIELIKEELMNEDLKLIDLNSDKDHNRSVFTYEGSPEAVLEGTKRLSRKTLELVDMRKHKGSHPRMGAIDVVPFIPVKNISQEEAVEVAKEYGKFLGGLGVPVYFYEDAQEDSSRKSLVKIREGQYEGLEERISSGAFLPDEGPSKFNPKSGGTVTGSRFALLAFNINLDTRDIDSAKKVVKAIRGAKGGYKNVRAIALDIPDKEQVQISMNLTNYEETPIHRVYETIKSELSRYNINIASSELVGPVPVYAFKELLSFYIKLEDEFSMDQVYM